MLCKEKPEYSGTREIFCNQSNPRPVSLLSSLNHSPVLYPLSQPSMTTSPSTPTDRGKLPLPRLPVPAASHPHHQPDTDVNSACKREEAPLASHQTRRGEDAPSPPVSCYSEYSVLIFKGVWHSPNYSSPPREETGATASLI